MTGNDTKINMTLIRHTKCHKVSTYEARVVIDDITLKRMWFNLLNIRPLLEKGRSNKFFINREGGTYSQTIHCPTSGRL